MFDRSSATAATSASGAPPADLLSELLTGMRLFGVDYRRIELPPPFGIAFTNTERRAAFHFVARGPVFLRRPDGTVHAMGPGDAVLLPRGGAHDLVSAPDLPGRDIAAFATSPLCRSVCAISGDADEVEDCSRALLVFSGSMEFDLGGMNPLVGLMPEWMFAGTLIERYPEIPPLLEAMEREACRERAGCAGILARLAEIVSALIVRAWVECGCGDAPGWAAGLRDPRLVRVIAAVHRDPGRDWSVAELAIQMGSSRSVFAERFQAVTGMTPLRYLTELRMHLAAQWIGRDRLPIDEAAHRLGYGSQAAFSRAFKRVTGHAPGAAR